MSSAAWPSTFASATWWTRRTTWCQRSCPWTSSRSRRGRTLRDPSPCPLPGRERGSADLLVEERHEQQHHAQHQEQQDAVRRPHRGEVDEEDLEHGEAQERQRGI